MKNIKNKYVGSVMMFRGKKKVYLSNAITNVIESKLKEPCGAVMINGTEDIFAIESRYYDSLRMFTIITNNGVIESIECNLSDDWKDKLFGEQDISEMLNRFFISSLLTNGYTRSGESTRFDTSYYRNKTQVDNKIISFAPSDDLYGLVLGAFDI